VKTLVSNVAFKWVNLCRYAEGEANEEVEGTALEVALARIDAGVAQPFKVGLYK
jgi:hypothetical protein